MNQNSNTTRQLEQLLREQLRHIELLTRYLDSIRESIAYDKLDDLNDLLQTGCPSMLMLDTLQKQQEELLAQQGLKSGPDGLTQWIDQLAQPELETLAQSLLHKLQQLQKSLLINDLLIRKNQERVRQSIHILSGRSGPAGLSVYSSSGRTDNGEKDRRHLATA